MKSAELEKRSFRLAFVQLGCPSYKREMFENIAALPSVNLNLFIGDRHPSGHAPNGDLSGLKHLLIRNLILKIFGLQLVWQSINKHINPKNYDLIILPEGVLYFSNYLLMLRAFFAGTAVGFYSHGFNHQRKESILGKLLEAVRQLVHRRAALVITYSQTGADFIVRSNPAMAGRVFVALNTLDVNSIHETALSISRNEILKMRTSWGFSLNDVVLAFVGRISNEKNPQFVISAVRELRHEGFSVRALFIGDGPALQELRSCLLGESEDVQASIKLLGRVSVSEVTPILKASDISVMPGMTGLAIVHSFAVGVPYVTIESPLHSPEIEYLISDVNGIITKNSNQSFIGGVRTLIKNPELRTKMGASGNLYALANLGINKQMSGFEEAFKYVINSKKCATPA